MTLLTAKIRKPHNFAIGPRAERVGRGRRRGINNSSFYDFMLDTVVISVLYMFRLLQKGLALMTVALAEIDVALARLGYRGLGSRELVIENTGHYDPGGRSRQVTLTNTSGLKRLEHRTIS